MKDIEPRETLPSMVAEPLLGSEGNTSIFFEAPSGSKTTRGPQSLSQELGKVFKEARMDLLKILGQRLNSKSLIIPLKELRCIHSSEEMR